MEQQSNIPEQVVTDDVPDEPGTEEAERQDASDGVDPASLAVELDEARREASENYDRYLRVHAEMDNYKKRIERTYADLARNSKKDMLLKLLGVKDNLERALNYGESAKQGGEESVLQGVRLTEYQLDQLLRSEGVTPMDLKGEPFNPEEAEAVGTRVDPEAPDHTVAEVVQQGYKYQEQVLRPAKVIVAVKNEGEEI